MRDTPKILSLPHTPHTPRTPRTPHTPRTPRTPRARVTKQSRALKHYSPSPIAFLKKVNI
ncbi:MULTISPECIES: hypothetical protein [unclassified Microcoleus]|uniref:hypothetical protein n=1 Tax=unclassified Microcoleus TaxID=2642155 RepID=UPI002FD64711